MTTAELQYTGFTNSTSEQENVTYERANIYTSDNNAETTNQVSLSKNFSPDTISAKKKHIREMNKLVSKWR